MIALFIAVFIWGASPIAIKGSLMQIGVIEVVALRFILATPVMVAITLLLKGKKAFIVDKADIPYFILLGTVGITITFILKVLSISFTTVTNFSLLYNFSTIFIMVISFVLLKESLTKRKITGAVIAFAGLVLLITNGNPSLSPNLTGDIIALACALSWGLYTVLSKKMNEKYSAFTVLIYIFIIGSLELLPVYLLYPHIDPSTFNLTTWASLAFQIGFSSIIAFFTYNICLEKISLSKVAMALYIMPLSGVALGIVLLGEPFSVYTVIGGLLTMFGIYFAEKTVMTKDLSVERDIETA